MHLEDFSAMKMKKMEILVANSQVCPSVMLWIQWTAQSVDFLIQLTYYILSLIIKGVLK